MHTFYRCEEGYEEDSANVIQNLRHEARVQAVRDYYALRGIKKTKPACRDKFLSKEQYMKVILKALYLLPSFSNSYP